MREIKVAYCRGRKAAYDPSGRNVTDYVVSRQEAHINDLGGIAGIPVTVSNEYWDDDFGGEDLVENLVEKGYHIVLGLPTQILRKNPDFPDKFGGLIFCDVDPVEPIRAPNLFDTTRELLDNRQFVGFIASQLRPTKVILLQRMTATITEQSFGRYENVLKEYGWSGQFCPFPISESDLGVIETVEFDSEGYKEVVGSLRSRLDNLIIEWDKQAPILVVSNLGYLATNWFLDIYLITTRNGLMRRSTLVHADLSGKHSTCRVSRKKQFYKYRCCIHWSFVND